MCYEGRGKGGAAVYIIIKHNKNVNKVFSYALQVLLWNSLKGVRKA
jgi:hypothetical protein